MKAIALEIKDGVAAVLREDGVIVTTRQPCEVGQTIELQAEVVSLPTRRKKWARTAVAAALAVVILGGALTYSTATASAYVSLDVADSSIELTINHFGRVIGVRAINDASQPLADSLHGDLRHMPVADALDFAASFLGEQGCLGREDAPLVAGVTAGSDRYSERLTQAVESSFGEGGGLFTMDVSAQERRMAMENDLSGGRYAYEQRFGGPMPTGEAPDDEREDDWDDDLDDDDVPPVPAQSTAGGQDKTENDGQALPAQSVTGAGQGAAQPTLPVPGGQESVPAAGLGSTMDDDDWDDSGEDDDWDDDRADRYDDDSMEPAGGPGQP